MGGMAIFSKQTLRIYPLARKISCSGRLFSAAPLPPLPMRTVSLGLLGPPELRKPTEPPSPPEARAAQPPPPPPTGDPFIDHMVSDFNKTVLSPPMGFTENMSATYLSSGDPCLDFFFHVVPDTPPASLERRLSAAWDHDAPTALKLIFNLRGIRGTGKSDKEGFYTAAIWLHRHHPKTLAANITQLAEFGYLKDLPEILFRLLEGGDVRSKQKSDWSSKQDLITYSRSKLKRLSKEGITTKNQRVVYTIPSLPREERRLAMAKKAIDRYTSDPDFRHLHDLISDVFAEALRSDLKNLEAGKIGRITLAAKWCPSVDSSYDRSTLLCEAIARKVFDKMSHPEYQGIEDAHYLYRVRDRLRKEVLVPLRQIMKLPEVFIGAGRWDSIPYERVSSVAMKLYKDQFLKHDGERFAAYLGSVKKGEAKIAAGALLPHEIIKELSEGGTAGVGDEVAELQWKRTVDDLLAKGKLRNCMAICDVSGSMEGTPMDVSVALGLLVSDLSDEPWKGKLITFSADPTLQTIAGDSLREKMRFVTNIDWGMNTDFQKVFDLILAVAVNAKLKPEQMIKRLFVFSDMEFDQARSCGSYYYSYGPYRPYTASASAWDTDYEVIVRKFTEKGYGDAVPEIVFWNLRDSRATPVPARQKGVALVSGFSKNLLKVFFNEDGVINPLEVMQAAISREEYQKLVVVD